MSLEETKDKLEWRKSAFECELKNSCGVEKWNDLIYIDEKEVNKISKCNLIHDIINPPKRTENININYYPILHVCMYTWNIERNLRASKFYWTVDVAPQL